MPEPYDAPFGPPRPEAGTRFFYGWVIVILGMAIWVLVIGGLYTFGIFFKSVAAEFGWSRAATSMASSLIFLVSGLLAFSAGALADRYGPRIVVVACGLLTGGGYVLVSRVGLHTSLDPLWQYYLFFLLVGMGMSAASAPIMSTVSRWFVEKRGQALGLTTVGGGLGQVIMPLLAGFLLIDHNWRTSYVIMGVIIGAGTIGMGLFLRRGPRENGTSTGGGPPGIEGDPEAASGLSFTFREAIRTRAFWSVLAAAFLAVFGQVMVLMHLVNYATDPGIGISRGMATTFIAVIGGANIAGKLVVGPVSDRIGRKAALASCFAVAGVMMLLLTRATSPWMFYGFAVIYGFAFGGWIPMFPAIIGDLFGTGSLGALIGATQAGNGLGGGAGPFMAGLIYDQTGSYFLAFVMVAVLFFAATGLILSIKRPER
ncbi:MAG: MFS transporter [Dehalococcoidia bacterium]